MEITELDGLFMTPARRKALAGVLALAERGRVELRGLAGSAPALSLIHISEPTRRP